MNPHLVDFGLNTAFLALSVFEVVRRRRRMRQTTISAAARHGWFWLDVGWLAYWVTAAATWGLYSFWPPADNGGTSLCWLVATIACAVIMLYGYTEIPDAERPQLSRRRAPSGQSGETQ